MTRFPASIETAASLGQTSIGDLLDSMQTAHNRHVRENLTEYRKHGSIPIFNREGARAELLARWPHLAPGHHNTPAMRHARKVATKVANVLQHGPPTLQGHYIERERS